MCKLKAKHKEQTEQMDNTHNQYQSNLKLCAI